MNTNNHGKAIVCVDDEKIVLNSLQTMLARNFGSDYVYEFAESAEEAIEVIGELVEQGYVLDTVISDWLMPGMKGDEFLSQVNTRYPHMKKVLLTGHADSNVIRKIETDNTDGIHCIFKPWKEGSLLDVIKHDESVK